LITAMFTGANAVNFGHGGCCVDGTKVWTGSSCVYAFVPMIMDPTDVRIVLISKSYYCEWRSSNAAAKMCNNGAIGDKPDSH
jgi:hypothetical protein